MLLSVRWSLRVEEWLAAAASSSPVCHDSQHLPSLLSLFFFFFLHSRFVQDSHQKDMIQEKYGVELQMKTSRLGHLNKKELCRILRESITEPLILVRCQEGKECESYRDAEWGPLCIPDVYVMLNTQLCCYFLFPVYWRFKFPMWLIVMNARKKSVFSKS